MNSQEKEVNTSLPSSARDRIIACAAPIFSKRGFSGSSVAEIASEAEVSKSTVFHHFATKRQLYLAVIESAASDFARTLETVLEEPGDLLERLANFQNQHLAHITDNAWLTQLVLRELQKPDSAEARHLVEDVLSLNYKRLIKFIAHAQEEKMIRQSVSASVAAMMLMSANVFYFQHQHVFQYLPDLAETLKPCDYAKAVTDLIFYGLEEEAA